MNTQAPPDEATIQSLIQSLARKKSRKPNAVPTANQASWRQTEIKDISDGFANIGKGEMVGNQYVAPTYLDGALRLGAGLYKQHQLRKDQKVEDDATAARNTKAFQEVMNIRTLAASPDRAELTSFVPQTDEGQQELDNAYDRFNDQANTAARLGGAFSGMSSRNAATNLNLGQLLPQTSVNFSNGAATAYDNSGAILPAVATTPFTQQTLQPVNGKPVLVNTNSITGESTAIGGGGVNITNNNSAENKAAENLNSGAEALAKAAGADVVAKLSDSQTAAARAKSQLPSLASAIQLNPKTYSGTLAEQRMMAAKALSLFLPGFDAEKASASEGYLSSIGLVIKEELKDAGANPSNIDLTFLRGIQASNLAQTQAGREFILKQIYVARMNRINQHQNLVSRIAGSKQAIASGTDLGVYNVSWPERPEWMAARRLKDGTIQYYLPEKSAEMLYKQAKETQRAAPSQGNIRTPPANYQPKTPTVYDFNQ